MLTPSSCTQNRLLQRPIEWLPPLEVALGEVAATLNEPRFEYDLATVQLHIGLEGSFGALATTPRALSTALLAHTVCLEGIITSCSLVRPKLIRSVHYAEGKKTFLMREYWDATMISGHGSDPSATSASASSLTYPTADGTSEKLVSEFGLSVYRDYQTVSMQEMPERAPAGQLPRSVDVILDDDLVDMVKPGDRVQLVGIYKSLSSSTAGGLVPSSFKAAVIGMNVRILSSSAMTSQAVAGKEGASSPFSSDTVKNIKDIARRRDAFDLLSRSLAPSIYGHEWVKKAVLLMLFGGVEKNLANGGTHLRGDINLMLVGDPSTAKSQMLRFVLSMAPLAIATTGRGSSGVGLTAAVTTDRETGERRLEAGAMVLADRGIVCIDEFDKMSDVDRVAIHEVMEQQTVTIAKAGIHASLNARCSVLAAANPIWGQYRETASPQENIRLPDSLLSRFDLLFIILDTSNPEHDARISRHVLRMHRHIPHGLAEGQPIIDNGVQSMSYGIDEDEAAANGGEGPDGASSGGAVFQAKARFSRPAREAVGGEVEEEEEDADGGDDELLTISFLKRYIHYARSTMTPVLTKSATDYIVAAYADFRQKRAVDGNIKEAKTFPVTPRTLETLIRLATAHAKSRLSPRVEKKDARVAQELLQYCLYKEVKKKVRKGAVSKRSRQHAAADSHSSSDEGDDVESEGVFARGSKEGEAGRHEETASSTAAELGGLSLREIESGNIALGSLDLGASSSQGRVRSQPLAAARNVLGGDEHEEEEYLVSSSMAMASGTQASGAKYYHSLSQESSHTPEERALHATGKEAAVSDEEGRLVRGVLHRLRSSSTSAIFKTDVDEIMEQMGAMAQQQGSVPALSARRVMLVLEEMQDLNQVMITEGLVYIM